MPGIVSKKPCGCEVILMGQPNKHLALLPLCRSNDVPWCMQHPRKQKKKTLPSKDKQTKRKGWRQPSQPSTPKSFRPGLLGVAIACHWALVATSGLRSLTVSHWLISSYFPLSWALCVLQSFDLFLLVGFWSDPPSGPSTLFQPAKLKS